MPAVPSYFYDMYAYYLFSIVLIYSDLSLRHLLKIGTNFPDNPIYIYIYFMMGLLFWLDFWGWLSEIRSLWLSNNSKGKVDSAFWGLQSLESRSKRVRSLDWTDHGSPLSLVERYNREPAEFCIGDGDWLSDCSWKAFFLYSRTNGAEYRLRICYWSNLGLGISIVKWDTEICI